MDGLISSAYAQSAAGQQQGSMFGLLAPLLVLGVFFYFMVLRPHQKRTKDHNNLIASLEVGSEIATNGGIIGKVTELNEQFLTVEIADGVNVKVQRHAVLQVLPKGTLKSA